MAHIEGTARLKQIVKHHFYHRNIRQEVQKVVNAYEE